MPKRVLVFNDTSPGRHFGCYAVMHVLADELRRRDLEPVEFWECGRDWHGFEDRIRALKPDAIVVNGEGTVHTSASRPRAQHLAQLGPFARDSLGCPSVMLNASFYDIDKDSMAGLGAFDRVFTRESASLRYLQQNGVRAQTVPDLSFFSRPPQTVAGAGGLLVTDSVLRPVAEELRIRAESAGHDYRVMRPSRERSGLTRLRDQLGAGLNKAGRALLRRPPLARQVTPNPGFDPFIAAIAGASGVITGRLHTLTLSLAQRVPVVAFESNTPKIADVLTDIFGQTTRSHPGTPEEIARVFAEWEALMPFTTAEREALEAYLSDGAARKDRMFDEVAALI